MIWYTMHNISEDKKVKHSQSELLGTKDLQLLWYITSLLPHYNVYSYRKLMQPVKLSEIEKTLKLFSKLLHLPKNSISSLKQEQSSN